MLQSQVPSEKSHSDRPTLTCGPHAGLPYRKVLSCMNVKIPLTHRNTYITVLLIVLIKSVSSFRGARRWISSPSERD